MRLLQAAGVRGCCRFGDGAKGPGCARGMFCRDQAQVSADCGVGEPVPVADFHGQSKCGQRRDAPQALQCPDNRGVFAFICHRGDRLIEAVTAVRDLMPRLYSPLERTLRSVAGTERRNAGGPARARGVPVHACPPEYTMPWRYRSLEIRCRERLRSPRTSSRERTRLSALVESEPFRGLGVQ